MTRRSISLNIPIEKVWTRLAALKAMSELSRNSIDHVGMKFALHPLGSVTPCGSVLLRTRRYVQSFRIRGDNDYSLNALEV